MRMTEADAKELLSKPGIRVSANSVSDVSDLTGRMAKVVPMQVTLPEKAVKASQGLILDRNHYQIILPFKLPTWNQLFAMDHWQRAKVRTWIKERVSECIQSGIAWPTRTGSARKLLLTDLSLAEYSEMITPNASKRLALRKKLAKSKRQ